MAKNKEVETTTEEVKEEVVAEPKVKETETKEVEVKETKAKSGKGLYVVIALLCLLLLGTSGYIVVDKVIINKKEANPNTTTVAGGETTTEETTTAAQDEPTTTPKSDKETSKKIDIKKYCTDGGNCSKTIGELDFEGKKVDLAVDFKKFNVAGASGTINLRYMREKDFDINGFLPSANNYYTTKGYLNIDGFEVYKNYFIVYLKLGSDGEPEKTDVPVCTVDRYAIYIFDQYLNELAYFESYQSGRPLLTTKFEDGYIYYRGLTSVSDTDERTKVVMKKDTIDNIIDPPCLHDCEEESAVIVSDVNEC